MTDKEKIKKAIGIAYKFGTIDGAHHKMWVIDQMVRSLTDSPIITKRGISMGQEYEYQVFGESKEYLDFINVDEDEMPWDNGIAP